MLKAGKEKKIVLGDRLSTFHHYVPIKRRSKTDDVEEISALSWSSDGTYLVSSSFDFTAQVWVLNSNGGSKLLTYTGHDNEVYAVAWQPNGNLIASYGTDTKYGTSRNLHIWNAHSGEVLRFGIPMNGNVIRWSPNGKNIIVSVNTRSSKHNGIGIYKIATGDKFGIQGVPDSASHSEYVYHVAVSPNGANIATASADKTIQVRGSVKQVYKGHPDAVVSVAWSPDNRYIASASADGTIRIWDVLTANSIRTYQGHAKGVTAVAWSPIGTHVASIGGDKLVKIWDAFTGADIFIYTGHNSWFNRLNALAWSPNGRCIATGDKKGEIQIWQAM